MSNKDNFSDLFATEPESSPIIEMNEELGILIRMSLLF